jgi:thiamine monophosphate synthase
MLEADGARPAAGGRTIVLAKEAVVPAIAVGGITDDGVEQVIQMAAQLMLAPVLGKSRTRL